MASASLGLRLLSGGVLAWWVGLAVAAPELTAICAAAALAIAAVTMWRPAAGLLLVAGFAPAGVLFAAPPIRAPELFAWSFLAAWLVAVWRPLSSTGWPRPVTVPATVFAAVLTGSWLALTLGGAAGVSPLWLPAFLVQSITSDHLLFASPEAETWSWLQTLTGIAIFVAAIGVARTDRRVVQGVAWALVASAAVLALATLADVGRQWVATGYDPGFLLRYVSGERESLHFTDLNAAGSLYVMSGLTAVMLAVFDGVRRPLWAALVVVILPALWLAGSLSALMAAAVVMVLLAAARGSARWRPTRWQLGVAAVVVCVAIAASALLATQRGEGRATMGGALQLRTQFMETSARMLASAPAFGVGVGRYFDESSVFMPEPLREMYGNENAHNYFAQMFAELGMVGGLAFLWLIVAGVRHAWLRVRASDVGDGARLGLLAGTAAYLVSCLTGHPLLVAGAALPFWTAFGAVAADATDAPSPPTAAWAPRIAAIVAVLLAIHVGASTISALRADAPPPEQGFHGVETDADGMRFRWMTQHAVTYVPDAPGFLTFELRAPDNLPQQRPLTVDVVIAGQHTATETLDPGRWTRLQLGVRGRSRMPFRRVDLRANQHWMQSVRLGIRPAERPISAMVSEIDWMPVSSVP